MKFQKAIDMIANKSTGFMVHFEWIKGSLLYSDYFPDKHLKEPLIETQEEAWALAKKFAEATKGKTCNLYVIGSNFCPVEGYYRKKISNRG